jgi:hypothetical protein
MTRGNDPSLADIYREQGEIKTLVKQALDRAEEDRRAARGIEGRVRKLERWKSYVVGIVGGAGALMGYAFGTHK